MESCECYNKLARWFRKQHCRDYFYLPDKIEYECKKQQYDTIRYCRSYLEHSQNLIELRNKKMSIATAITNFKNRINAIYDVLEEKQAEMPKKKDTRNLPQTIESVPTSLDAKEEYTMVRRSDGVKSFYLIEGTLSTDSIAGLSDAVEVKLGANVTDIAGGVFSDCALLTSVTIRNKTWQDAIDNSYWGISDPNIMHGDWDKYISFANA